MAHEAIGPAGHDRLSAVSLDAHDQRVVAVRSHGPQMQGPAQCVEYAPDDLEPGRDFRRPAEAEVQRRDDGKNQGCQRAVDAHQYLVPVLLALDSPGTGALGEQRWIGDEHCHHRDDQVPDQVHPCVEPIHRACRPEDDRADTRDGQNCPGEPAGDRPPGVNARWRLLDSHAFLRICRGANLVAPTTGSTIAAPLLLD